ncbi:CHY zinc finger protein [Homoserinibacter gongjuensis]|uniref:CHY-type domain-containing protein n=1 Tax=Homoserinibacter gongjuensis TaxID=1162968 RepID=A0ABQ6JZH3_9MICO|nr:hypothetical protein GCM10025869_31330 [Homoserinibacter gongjuensis]
MRDAPLESHGVRIHGLPVDAETRCVHWHGPTDVVAIRFPCCDRFYPCHDCHEAVADHPAAVWPVRRREEHAILCGMCGTTHAIATYLAVEGCPNCRAPSTRRAASTTPSTSPDRPNAAAFRREHP